MLPSRPSRRQPPTPAGIPTPARGLVTLAIAACLGLPAVAQHPAPAPDGDASRAAGGAPASASPEVAPTLPDLALHTDAIVRSTELERRGRYLRIRVGEYLLGRGPEELYVEDLAFEPHFLATTSGDGWFVFLASTRQGLTALSACRASVVPLAVTGRPATDATAFPLAEPELVGMLHELSACRAPDGVARAARLVQEWTDGTDAPHRLVGLQLAVELARMSTSVPAEAPPAVLIGFERATAGTCAGAAVEAGITRLGLAALDFPEAFGPPGVTLRRLLAPVAPGDDADRMPAVSAASVAAPGARDVPFERALRIARAFAAAQPVPGPIDAAISVEAEAAPTRAALAGWMAAREGDLLAADVAFVDRLLRRDDDPLLEPLGRDLLDRLSAGAVRLPEPADAAARAEAVARLSAWAAERRAAIASRLPGAGPAGR